MENFFKVPFLFFVGFIVFIILFRKEIALLIRRIQKIKAKDFNIEANTEELKQLNAKFDNFNKFVEEEFAFKNYLSAHSALEKDINLHLEQCSKNELLDPQINIIVMAVSMVFSWRFMRDTIPELLDKNPELNIDLKLLWVDPNLLESIDLSRQSEVNWPDISRKRLEDTQEFLNLHPACRKRLKLQARIYNNLPHWHGILFNEKHLYMGRVNWSFPDDGRPKLSCGRNKYRYFDIKNDMGRERIDLFNNWYKYYTKYNSSLVYDSSQNVSGI